MATITGTRSTGMIKAGRQPRISAMTAITLHVRKYMTRIFASCCCTVMAAIATSRYIGMIDTGGWCPGICCMTGLTGTDCHDMSRMLARSLYTVVTAFTGTSNAHVIKVGGHPGISGVTGSTIIDSRNMARMLTCGLHTVVTVTTATSNIIVIEVGG